MTVVDVPTNRAFPGSRARVFGIPTGGFLEAKTWSKNGIFTFSPQVLVDNTVDFVADDIQPNDQMYVCDNGNGLTAFGIVLVVQDLHTLVLQLNTAVVQINGWYKIGIKQTHTFTTLANILTAAGPRSAVMRWGSLFSNATVQEFAFNHTGHLFVFDNFF